MPIIYSYPSKTSPTSGDLLLISDVSASNQTKKITIGDLKDPLDVVDALNSLTGNINITGGTNITVTPSGQNIEISTSASNVDGSGTAGTIPKWSDSNTLTDSDIYEFSVHKYIGIGVSNPQEKLEVNGNIKTLGNLQFFKDANSVKISTPSTITTSYELVMPAAVGTASQVLKLPSAMDVTPYQLAWGDAGSGSGTGGFETLPFTTANGYIAGETSTGTYVFQMIAPSNCAPANFKFYNFLAQSVERTTTVAIYKGVIGDEGAAGSLQSTGQIAGTLGAAQISGSTLTVVDGATAISAGDNIVVCFSIDEEIQPLGVVPTTASGGITLTNASPISNSKLAIHDSTVSLTAAQIQSSYTTVAALEAVLTSSAATTSRPFLIIY